jgi:hypothetical protein
LLADGTKASDVTGTPIPSTYKPQQELQAGIGLGEFRVVNAE